MSVNAAWFDTQRRRLPNGCIARESSSAVGAFLYGAVRLLRPGVVVEIGTHVGESSAWLCRAIDENAHGVFVGYDVDPAFVGATEETLRVAVPDAPVRVILEDITAMDHPIIDCDFCFLDPDPKDLYVPCYERIRLSIGGLLVAHDLTYDPEHVGLLLERMKADACWDIIAFQEERGLIVGRKL